MSCKSECIQKTLYRLKNLVRSVEDGYIFEDEETLERWSKSFSEVKLELDNYQKAVQIKFYHNSN